MVGFGCGLLSGSATTLGAIFFKVTFKEIVSCSNCTDYQANRLKMRYRTTDGNAAVHTLNSTAVATSRALVAIMEQNQIEDGRVRVPEILVPLMGGKQYLEPCEW